jgi:glycosyltransferase involved in cell wall biosynthesis
LSKFLPNPTVSVVIPSFNRAQLLHRAIDSVLTQTYEDFELIVVNDGSTDDLGGSLSHITDLRFRLVSHHENRGSAAARNTGISEARGQYVAFLDSDDYWLPEKLERQLEFMRSPNRCARISCTAYQIISRRYPDGELYFSKPVITEKDMQWGCRISPGTTLLAERAIFEEAGPMNEQMSRLEDWDWLLRCLRLTNLETLNEVLSVVDYCAIDRKIEYEVVRSSVDLMKHNHFITPGPLPSISRLRFLASLENELAVAAYGSRRYGLAIWHTLKSLCINPFRSLDSFRRIASGIFLDLRTPKQK